MLVLSGVLAVFGIILCGHFIKAKSEPPPHHYSIWYDLISGLGFLALSAWLWRLA